MCLREPLSGQKNSCCGYKSFNNNRNECCEDDLNNEEQIVPIGTCLSQDSFQRKQQRAIIYKSFHKL